MNERRWLSVRRAAAVLAVALLLGLLLAAQPLHTRAENLSSSALRAVAATVLWPFAKVNDALHIEGARQWAINAFEDDNAEAEALADDLAEDPMGSGRPPGLVLSAPPPTVRGSSTLVDGPAKQTHSTTTERAVRTTSTTGDTPRADDGPSLHVLVLGDSLVGEVAKALARASDELRIEVDYRFKVSSGLVNKGFFDWPAEAKRMVAKYKPDVTVMMYGNNDHLRLSVDGKVEAVFSPAWMDEYQRRVEAMAGIAKSAGSRVIWIGMPVMRGAKFSQTARTFNELYSRVCNEQGYWYLDAYRLFSDSNGEYAAYLPGPSGKPKLMRASDGIHFTAAGGDRVVREIIKILERHNLLES